MPRGRPRWLDPPPAPLSVPVSPDTLALIDRAAARLGVSRLRLCRVALAVAARELERAPALARHIATALERAARR